MPQMMPINWIMLFIFFIMIFIMFNMMNYYNFFLISKTFKLKSFKNKTLSWKW